MPPPCHQRLEATLPKLRTLTRSMVQSAPLSRVFLGLGFQLIEWDGFTRDQSSTKSVASSRRQHGMVPTVNVSSSPRPFRRNNCLPFLQERPTAPCWISAKEYTTIAEDLLANNDVECTAGFADASALFKPSGASIPKWQGEERASFTQFSAGGIFRYVDNGCQTIKELAEDDPKDTSILWLSGRHDGKRVLAYLVQWTNYL
ncbi:hypothetical protein B0H14DRAFT_2606705 [Mycena olivaceomarginata]|nr:hypothetical protein B0H14DRAFT_2606705 [Mycena olivaceomarginata]